MALPPRVVSTFAVDPRADDPMLVSGHHVRAGSDTGTLAASQWLQACGCLFLEHSDVRDIRNGPSEGAARVS